MKLKFINPDAGMTSEQLRYREKLLSQAARPDTIIHMDCLTDTQVWIDSLLDVAIAGPEIVRRALEAQREGYDAVCLYCLSDPAIDACREALDIPVLGGGQAALTIACGLGYRFSLLTTSSRRIPQKREFIRNLGIPLDKVASVRSIEVNPAEEQAENRPELIRQLSQAAKACVELDGADTIVLGCLSFIGLGPEISRRVGVPVVDPAYTLVNLAELYCQQGLSQSKIAYPHPPKQPRIWSSGEIDPEREHHSVPDKR